MFGRYPNCSVEFSTTKVSLDHCYIDVNPRSGVPMLHDTSRHHTTWLDGEQVTNPPYRAMVPHQAQRLRIHTASFQIRWSMVPREHASEHHFMLLRLAQKLHNDREVFNLTDLEADLETFPDTAPATFDDGEVTAIRKLKLESGDRNLRCDPNPIIACRSQGCISPRPGRDQGEARVSSSDVTLGPVRR
jgi:FHA domain